MEYFDLNESNEYKLEYYNSYKALEGIGRGFFTEPLLTFIPHQDNISKTTPEVNTYLDPWG